MFRDASVHDGRNCRRATLPQAFLFLLAVGLTAAGYYLLRHRAKSGLVDHLLVRSCTAVPPGQPCRLLLPDLWYN